jgi:3'-phosphoadenosine 5'-phosphosulfate sulfotransferase (PAPS reductase)/FAD synthetase
MTVALVKTTGQKGSAHKFAFPLSFPDHLDLTADQVALLSPAARRERIDELVVVANQTLDRAVELASTHMIGKSRKPREIAGVVGMFSGGNDSTTLAHLMQGRLTHLGHANTGIGISQTRHFVRKIAADYFNLPLIEKSSPRAIDGYRHLVLERGFPGPAQHWKMYQRLKERAFNAMRDELVSSGYQERVLFVAGRRRDESSRRAEVPELERERSIMWVSPMVLWTKLDLNLYRSEFDIPVNPVSEILHMSGECLCGSFAKPGEFEWLVEWFGDDEGVQLIAELEDLLEGREDIPPERRKWGWGAYSKNRLELMSRAKVGRLCAACPR